MSLKRKLWHRALAVFLMAVMFVSTPLADAMPSSAAPDQTQTESDKNNKAQDGTSDEKKDGSDEKTADTSSNTLYVSELRIFKVPVDKRDSERTRIEADGWSLIKSGDLPADFNAGTGRDDVLIGYKTTTDEKKAIRDIKLLEMDHGYEWFDYQRIAEGQMDKFEPMAADIATAAVEFRKNLEKGSKAATEAKDFLNFMYFTKDILSGDKSKASEKIYMGDYLAGTDVDQQLIKKLLVRMNSGSVAAICTQLSLAVSDSENNWAEKISKTQTYTTSSPTATQTKLWDRMYYEYSTVLLPKIKDFAKGYKAAVSREGQAATGAAAELEALGDAELSAGNVQSVIDAGGQTSTGDILYKVVYENLNKYTVGEKKAGDYLLSLAEGSYPSRTDYRVIYPLVEAMTDGQFAMCRYVGFEQMGLYLDQSGEFYSQLAAKKEEVRKNIQDATGGESSASVWTGVNSEFYERPVALTSDANRESKAGAVYQELTKEGKFYDNMNLAFMGIGLAASTASLITGVIKIGLMIAASKLTVWAACYAAIGTGFWASIGGIIGCAAVVGGYIFLAAMIVAAIVYAVKWLVDKFSDKEKEDYTKMPTEIYDIVQVKIDGKRKSEYIKYVPVTNESGSPQDVNADDGKRWALLYTSTNEDLGAPLCVDANGRGFIRVVDTPNTPSETKPVTGFGENTPANFNSFSRKESAAGIYLYFSTTETLAGGVLDSEEDKNNVGIDIDGNKFLYSLMISREDTESAAKAGIKRKPGFKVFDKNLTPGDKYTYIGYSLTEVEKDALRDIRIVPNYSYDMTFGGASYASAGVLPDGSAIVYTRYKGAGDPILGGIAMSDKILPPENELEPVNLFCGGNAYNLNLLNRKTKTKIYLYFKQKKVYTSGEKYISGIQFVSSRKHEDTMGLDDFIKELGVSDFGVEMASYPITGKKDTFLFNNSGSVVRVSYEEDPKIHMTYTYTYNPYRAIYDVGVYVATTRMNSMQQMITTREGSYAVAENLIISTESEIKNTNIKFRSPDGFEGTSTSGSPDTRTHEAVSFATNHSYINMPLTKFRAPKQTLNLEGNIAALETPNRLQNIYMLGPVEGKKPLKLSDIVVSSGEVAPSGMRPIRLFTDPYREKPVDLGYNSQNVKSTPVYMYIRGNRLTKPKYISSIEVVSYKRPENTSKHTYTEDELKLSDSYADDNCRIGLLAKCDGGVYNYNVATDQGTAWYEKYGAENSAATYFGVSRTDDENKAITGVILYKGTSGVPPIRIKVKGIEYHRTGDPINGYYFYYTKSPGANPGVPVTELSYDHTPIVKGKATALSIASPDSEDGKTPAVYDPVTNGIKGYIHLECETNNTVVSDIMILKGTDERQIKNDFMKQGFNYAVNVDLNYRAGGEMVFLAYKTCSADAAKASQSSTGSSGAVSDADDEDWSDFNMDFSKDIPMDKVIYDVICLYGEDAVKTMKHNGAEYELVSDVSLNEGTSGTKLYVYKTHNKNVKIDGQDTILAPLSAICACSGESVPSYGDKANKFGKWEDFLDQNGHPVNLNDGVISKTSDGKYINDCRLSLFLQRFDDSIKKGAMIDHGVTDGAYEIGNAYLVA